MKSQKQIVKDKIVKELYQLKKDHKQKLEEYIKKTQYARDSVDWSKVDWKKKVIKHYEGIYNKHFKNPLLTFLNHDLKIRIVGLVERDEYRIYAITAPWMIDTIVEIMIKLNSKQKKKMKLTEIDPLTNEKSRWVSGGTSLTDKYDNNSAEITGKHWAENVRLEVERIIYSDIHKMR